MSVCDVPVISNVCQVAGEATATLVSAPFEWLAAAMGEAASWLFQAVWSVFDTTTLVDVTRPERLSGVLDACRPQAVINCAGLVKQRREAADPGAWVP